MSSAVKSVLLVEDDEDDYILTSDYLQQVSNYEFDIQWTDSSTEALELLKQNKHDICLLDYQLGSINGLTVLKQAISEGCGIPIIMLTGQSDNQLDNDALDAGAVDYVVKSELNTNRFHRAIRYALSRKEIENERLERIKAETRNRSKDKFVAHLSHELRTPLTSILGYTELLLFNKDNAHIQSELNTILNNGKHLLGLLNNVLDLSKIAADKLELNYSTIALDSFIVDLYALLSVAAEDKGIELNINAKTALPLNINADELRLRQVFINLIHNAIKFTDKGQVNIDIWLETNNESSPKNTLHCTITDTGIGIPKHLLSTIFKPFEQVEDIVSRNEEGAGLGLAICCELLKQMNGTIRVESEVNVGSKFIISLDLGDLSNTCIEPLAFNRVNTSPMLQSLPSLAGHVLIVDDIKDIRILMGFICGSFDLETSFAINGEHAITKIVEAQQQANPFDAILMDIHMPVLDGKRAILQLREMGITTPIIAVTAATMKGVQTELKSLGFNDVVAKPVDKHGLYQVLSRCLNKQDVSKSTEQTTLQSKQQIVKTPKQEAKHFLIIEDDKDAAQITALLLNSLSIETTLAHSAAEALSLLSNGINNASSPSYDRILLDINLPDANGLELSKEIRELSPASKITIISGNDISAKVLLDFSIDQALLKPINLDMLKNLA
ncbi:response regulator [Pseudocolwellia sp. AS88]|uniref:response regulator n=1 Tax=Pseudocolwellia sp. AS88 TaxID=3063958 RepID=UPI0026ECE921|nr:response regulator [Pseudocolwellia sp. AS88]MDO7085235.1 response regulator [Pseudocolwellia sp. AS88]